MSILKELESFSSKLSPIEFIVYQVCKELWTVGDVLETSGNEIADKVGLIQRAALYRHLKSLKKKGFILYGSKIGNGIDILWVRQSVTDKVPTEWYLKRKQQGVRLIAPDGKEYTVLPNMLAGFCRQNKLHRPNVYELLRGAVETYKGWKAG